MGGSACAQDTGFGTGPVFKDFGASAPVDTSAPLPKDAAFNIAFDTAKGAEPGKLNKTLESAARFINMHVRAGVPAENINLAVIVHSKAVFDVSHAKDGKPHASIDAVKALTANNVRIIVCGQSAAFYGVSKADLLPNVEMQLSAMTAHALLQQQGYTLNPF